MQLSLIPALAGIAALLAPVSASAAPSSARTSGTALADTVTAPYIVVYERSSESPATTTDRLERSLGFVSSNVYSHSLRGFSAALTPGQVKALRRHSSVAQLVPDIEITGTPKERKSAQAAAEITPAGVERIGATEGGLNGPADGAVAVVDTGLDLANPDLNAANGINCIKTGKSAQDDNGHGTHIGGTIGARADGRDVVGAAPGTRLYAVKVLDGSNRGRLSGLLCGIDWVHANAERLDIRVANVSVAATGSDDGACGALNGDPLHAAICSSVRAGIVYVAAAGNGGTDFARTVPAAYSETLAVTATTDTDGLPGGAGGAACEPAEQDDSAATYSNFATTAAAAAHTIAAPGTCVTSNKVGGGVVTMLGTSMAAPHVSAAAALCLGTAGSPPPCHAADPTQRSRAVIDRLQRDAADAADDGFGFIGDPLQPLSGREMGHLVSVAGY